MASSLKPTYSNSISLFLCVPEAPFPQCELGKSPEEKIVSNTATFIFSWRDNLSIVLAKHPFPLNVIQTQILRHYIFIQTSDRGWQEELPTMAPAEISALGGKAQWWDPTSGETAADSSLIASSVPEYAPFLSSTPTKCFLPWLPGWT